MVVQVDNLIKETYSHGVYSQEIEDGSLLRKTVEVQKLVLSLDATTTGKSVRAATKPLLHCTQIEVR